MSGALINIDHLQEACWPSKKESFNYKVAYSLYPGNISVVLAQEALRNMRSRWAFESIVCQSIRECGFRQLRRGGKVSAMLFCLCIVNLKISFSWSSARGNLETTADPLWNKLVSASGYLLIYSPLIGQFYPPLNWFIVESTIQEALWLATALSLLFCIFCIFFANMLLQSNKNALKNR